MSFSARSQYGGRVIDALRTRLFNAVLYARALRATGAIELARPAQLVEFLRGAAQYITARR